MAPHLHVLLEGGAPIKLRPREWDILQTLIAEAGKFLSNDALIASVWPHQAVSEANLRVQIASLRRALGDGRGDRRFILNATGRGYCFAAPVLAETTSSRYSPGAPAAAGRVWSVTGLPSSLTRMLGRADTLERLAAHLGHQRLLTISGPGGIGKTTLAIVLAERHGSEHSRDVAFTDFGSVTEPSAVAAAVAGTLGLFGMSQDATVSVVHHLRERRVLLVLDNCEHLIDEVAALVDAILKGCPDVHILATSREPLRLDGEWVHRLRALDYPPRSAGLRSVEAMIYPAVQLFVERAAASQETFVLSDEDAPIAAEICRRLDGIPLALELAAARIDTFGVRELGARLADSLQLLKQGRRSTLPRHETLLATMEWSFALLTPAEQKALIGLSVFKNQFSIDEACSVLLEPGVSDPDLIDIVYELSAKSLIDTDATSDSAQLRLLELTRAFCRERFATSPTFGAVCERHAHLCLALLRRAEVQWRANDWSAWTVRYGRWIDDVRAAIEWAYGAGHERLGIELVAASEALATHLALLPEWLRRIDDALERLESLDEPAEELELQLRMVQGYHQQNTHGDQARMEATKVEMERIWSRVSGVFARWEAAIGLYGIAFGNADWTTAAENAERVRALVPFSGDSGAQTTADRMRAQVDHYQGRHEQAIARAATVIARPQDQMPSTFTVSTRINPKVTMRLLLARTAWLQGRPDSALVLVEECVDMSRRAAGNTYCYGLASAAIPVSAWGGDRDAALEYCRDLEVEATALSLDYWQNWARGYVKALEGQAVSLAGPGVIPRDGHTVGPLQFDEVCAIRPDLADDRIIARVRSGELGWCAPEMLRAHAERAARDGAPELEVRAGLLEALALAREQGALAWELRIATSLARWPAGEPEQARDRLEETLSRFTEGFDAPDFMAARTLLDAMSASNVTARNA